MSLKVRLAIYSSLVLMVVFALYLGHHYRQDMLAMEKAEIENIELRLSGIKSEIDERFHVAWLGAKLIAGDEIILETFAKRDRESLQAMLLPQYKSIQDQVAQFHFHLPDSTSFLRLHEPAIYGDSLLSSRPGVRQANESKKVVRSFETGLGGFGARVIMPLSYQGEHVGTVEMGARLDQDFLMELKNNYGSEFFIYDLKNSDQFLAATLDFDPYIIKENIQEVIESDDLVIITDNRQSAITIFPLFDYNDEMIAYFKMVSDRSEILSAISNRQITMMLHYIAGVILAAFLVMYTLDKSILRPLGDFGQYLQRVSSLDFSERLPVARKDELGEMAINLNNTVDIVKNSIDRMENSHKQTLLVLDNITAVVYVADLNSHEILFMNKYGRDLYGDVIGKKCYQALQNNQDRPCEFCQTKGLSTKAMPGSGVISWEVKSTIDHKYYNYRCTEILWLDGRRAKLSIGTDQTEKIVAEEMARQGFEWYRAIAEDIPALVNRFNNKFELTFVNNAYSRFVGLKREEIIGKNLFQFILPQLKQKVYDALKNLTPNNQVATYVNPKEAFDGSIRWVKWSTRAVFDLNGKLLEYIGVGEDITEQKEYENRLMKLSLYDGLTGVYNKMYFDSEIKRLEGGREYPVSIIVADLDHLKIINDTYGHKAGDQLLKTAAQVISNAVRMGDVVARIGGDEFAVIMKQASQAVGEKVISRIESGINDNNLKQVNVVLSLSTGLSVAEGPQKPLDEVFIEADNNMYLQKAKKKLGKKSIQ